MDWLWWEADVAAYNFRRRAVGPRGFYPHSPPGLVQPPQESRQPGEAGLQHHHFQVRMLGEDALDDQAGELGLERLRLGNVILDVIGAPADRGRRVVIGAAGMDADGEPQPFGGGIDR